MNVGINLERQGREFMKKILDLSFLEFGLALPEPQVVADERFLPHVRHCEQTEEAGSAASFCKFGSS